MTPSLDYRQIYFTARAYLLAYLFLRKIDKIVSAYKNRSEIEKYSHVASLSEIKDNDYNLNIPRYVDTFEEEEAVDIEATKKEILRLEAELKSVQNKMSEYLAELGL